MISSSFIIRSGLPTDVPPNFKTFISTPMISLGTVRKNASAGIIITASHNPPSYNGYKIKASYGGPATPDDIEKVESQIPDTIDLKLKSVADYQKDGLVEFVNLED